MNTLNALFSEATKVAIAQSQAERGYSSCADFDVEYVAVFALKSDKFLPADAGLVAAFVESHHHIEQTVAWIREEKCSMARAIDVLKDAYYHDFLITY